MDKERRVSFSLDFDIEAVSVMNEEERKDYFLDLNRRRTKAHKAD
jgi:hypothetical protein